MTHTNAGYNHTVAELFEEMVNKQPQHPAISFNDKTLSYQSLNEKANQLGHWLQNQSVKSGEIVGILLDPGIDFIVSVLAVIKIGAVYLPLDALAPHRRLSDILDDANPKIVVTSEDYAYHFDERKHQIRLIRNMHLASAAYPRENLKHCISPISPIYMMYTSGSTGRPKGVIVSHRSVVNLVSVENCTQVNTTTVFAQFSNLAFDASPYEIWSALLNGAKLPVVPQDSRHDHTKLKFFLEKNDVQHLFLPTGFFHQITKSAPDTLNSVDVVVFGGEQVNKTLLKNFIAYRKKHRLRLTLINGYGPTEATTFTCLHIMNENTMFDDDQMSSIGQQLKNIKTYILDENKNPVSEGELYISGVNLALSYHNSLQNQEKFIRNPFCQDDPYLMLYKTGDRVRKLPSGDLLCLGRVDDQVKIGGFRIHLNEIENQLMQYPYISLAAVKVEMGGGSHQMLAAYIVLSSEDAKIHADEIRQFLSDVLPPYMLPSKYILVSELPLTLVGKVDKSKLDSIPHTDLSFHVDTSSSSPIEEKIKIVWQYLLNRTTIDVNKNLFELGANSLLVTEACVQINESLQSELQVSNIFSYPTIHKLSRYLEGNVEKIQIRETKKISSSDIAIIGMSCRFPNANSLSEFWDNLCQAEDCLTRFSKEELSKTGTNHKLEDDNFVPVRGILDDIDKFDANFFGFSPVDASVTDPQQRLFLECAWEALEHAGVAPDKIKNKTISVFAGMAESTYLHENLLRNNWFCKEYDRLHQRIVSGSGMLSTQVSYRLNLRGRSLNINTACSTGLVTVAQACQDLMVGASDVALAGAVSIAVPQIDGYMYQNGGIESPDGYCRPFDQEANGTVFSNGVGVVILKRLDDALAENDTIYAVINGSGINNDGSDKLGFTAPSTSGQIACIRDALSQADINAIDVGYIETHGTATALGDMVEFDSLSAVFGTPTEDKQSCALGSIKGNIGHTDIAAGLAGLIKTALCLHYQKIPPTLHFKCSNPNINFEKSPFFINSKLIDWKTSESKRYAGVSAFGVGGTNAHLILSEHIRDSIPNGVQIENIIILSAKTEQALEKNTQKLIQHLSLQADLNASSINLIDVAYTLQTGREDFQWRRIGIGKTTNEILKNLAQSEMTFCSESIHHNIVFMFPGQGMQYHNMASQLMDAVPYFASIVEKGIHLANTYLNCDLLDVINNPNDSRLNQTQYAQPALFILEYAMAKLLINYGVTPSALIGHSIGEYVAACVSGVFSFEDAIALVCERGLLMASVPMGSMLAIECSAEEFSTYQNIADVELALHNATNHCVASGSAASIEHLQQHLLEIGKSCQKLKVSHAFHSHYMEKIEAQFKGILSNIQLSAPLIPIISNVTGDWLSTSEATNPDYWYRHLRHTVQLCKGFETLLADEHPFFIEAGPGRSLSGFLKEVAQSKNPCITHTLPNQHRRTSDLHQLHSALGSLWENGIQIKWEELYRQEKPRHIPLPTYSFQKQRYWIEPDQVSVGRHEFTPSVYKPVWSHQQAFLKPIALSPVLLAQHSWIIFKDEIGLGDQLISLLEKNNVKPIVVIFNKTYSEKDNINFKINPTDKQHYLRLIRSLKNNLRHPIILHLSSFSDDFNKLPSSKEIDKQLELGFYSLLCLSQAYIEEMGAELPLKIGVITTGTQQLIGLEDINPINAILNGSCRVIMQEHRTLSFKLIDLNTAEHPQNNVYLLSKIVESCLHDDWDEASLITPYRDGHRWQLMYGLVNPLSVKIKRLKNNGIYLLTGGMGGIALSCCEAIVKTVSTPTFILLTRREIPLETEWEIILQDKNHPYYEKIKQMCTLQTLGANLLFFRVDITQFELLNAVIRRCVNDFGKIDGLIHAAGISNAELIQFKTKTTAQSVFLPKIYGTYNLIRALKDLSLDFVVLKSSLAALLGGFRQIDYCGANASLDSFITSNLFSFASFAVSINWNTWRDVGIAAEAALKGEATFLGKGNDISPQQGQKLFLEVLQGNESHVAISNVDLNVDTGMHSPMMAPSPTDHGIKIARQDLNVVPNYLAPADETEYKLAQLWQDTLGIEEIGMNDDFFALGGHSLKAISLIEKINKSFQCSLPATQIYHTPTIKQLYSGILGSKNKQNNNPIRLKMVTEKPPHLFLCHPISGLIHCFNSFISQSDLPVSIYGLQDPSIEADKMLYSSLHAMAEDYLSAIKKIQPVGPYLFMGYSFGGNVLYEVANMLHQQGQTISLLAMIDSWAINSDTYQHEKTFKNHFQTFHPELPTQLLDLAWEREELLLNHTPSKVDQEIVLFKALQLSDSYRAINHATNGWSGYNKNKIVCHKIDGNHDTIINPANSKTILRILSNYLIQQR